MVPTPYHDRPDTGTAATKNHNRMKRSRAYDDLVALAEEAEAHRNDACCAMLSGWEPFLAPGGRLNRFKRSRGAMTGAGEDDDGESARHALQFALEMTDMEGPAARSGCSSASSSSASLSSIASDANDDDDDVLPLRRNSREHIMMLQQQKKQRLHQISNGEDASAELKLAADDAALALLATPETPEARVLRAGYAREALCIDPLDKCQPPPQFDISAFIMLSISPKR